MSLVLYIFVMNTQAKTYTADNLTAEDFARVEREALERGDRTLARLANRASIGNLLPYAKQRVADELNRRGIAGGPASGPRTRRR